MSESEEAPRRYITTRKFTQNVNGSTILFEAGAIVEREDTIRTLLAMGAPIAKIEDEDDIGTCPHCGKSFSMQAQRGARELLAKANKIMGYK